MFKKILTASGLSAALIASALVSAPAASAAGVGAPTPNPASQISLKVTAKDVVSGTRVANPIRLDIKVPQPYYPTYGGVVEHRYEVRVKTKGSKCFLSNASTYSSNYGSETIFVGYEQFAKSNISVWGKPGKCAVEATMTASSNYSMDADKHKSWAYTVTSKTSFNVRAKNSVTKPKVSASKVKKGKKVTLSGKASYAYAANEYAAKLTKANVSKKTPLVLQQKVAGSKKWKNVKTVKVGSKGKWSTKVKVKKTTQYRVVLKKSAKYVGKTSSATKVTVKK